MSALSCLCGVSSPLCKTKWKTLPNSCKLHGADIPLLCVALYQQKLLVLRQLVAHGNLCLGLQGAGYLLPWLRRMGDGSTSTALPLALRRGWYPPDTKVNSLAATSCMKHAVLLFHEHSAGFCHLTVSLRSPVAVRHSGTPPCTAKSQHELFGYSRT